MSYTHVIGLSITEQGRPAPGMQVDSNDEAVVLSVRITSSRAQKLWHTAAAAAPIDLEDRFEYIEDSPAPALEDEDFWASGTVMWCDSALDAFTLADYETSLGFANRLLWDLAMGPNWPGGYAVLSTRPVDSPW